jgi:hypothetical protein
LNTNSIDPLSLYKTKGKDSRKPGNEVTWIDPSKIRFQHSRIRPTFSCCGRTIEDTLNEIRTGKTNPADIPPIQVLMNPSQLDWYFTLNNRRLYVFKKCLEEGLLISSNNTIPVRIRKPKSSSELTRYTIENCSLCAKLIDESRQSNGNPICPGQRSRTMDVTGGSHKSNFFVPIEDCDPLQGSNFESDDFCTENIDETQVSTNRLDDS